MVLTAALGANAPAISVAKVASIKQMTGLGDIQLSFASAILPVLRGHIGKIFTPSAFGCGFNPVSPGCTPYVNCPKHCPCQDGGISPSSGDPVNLATGEEEYTPDADLSVYNPVGPSVTWSRIYDSARNYGDGYSEGDPFYQCCDYGPGWSEAYNIVIYDPTEGGIGTTNTKDLVLANGGVVQFTAPATPSAGAPVQCTVQPGMNMLIEWDYSATSSTGTYKVTMKDRSQMTFGPAAPNTNCYQLKQETDRNGNAITFNYGAPATTSPVKWSVTYPPFYGPDCTLPLLSSIQNTAGTVLLNILRTPDGTGNIWQVQDCYGRSVYYNVSDYPAYYANQNGHFSGEIDSRLLDHVSQVTSSCSPSQQDRYVYAYSTVRGAAGGNGVDFYKLTSITIPRRLSTNKIRQAFR
jgi:hypothetical protein